MIHVLLEHSETFASNHVYIKGILLDIFQHHIYIEDDATPMWQP